METNETERENREGNKRLAMYLGGRAGQFGSLVYGISKIDDSGFISVPIGLTLLGYLFSSIMVDHAAETYNRDVISEEISKGLEKIVSKK